VVVLRSAVSHGAIGLGLGRGLRRDAVTVSAHQTSPPGLSAWKLPSIINMPLENRWSNTGQPACSPAQGRGLRRTEAIMGHQHPDRDDAGQSRRWRKAAAHDGCGFVRMLYEPRRGFELTPDQSCRETQFNLAVEAVWLVILSPGGDAGVYSPEFRPQNNAV
jgi:hypothetical protein